MHVVTRNTNNIVSFDVKPERFYTEINRIWCSYFSKRKRLWTSEEDIYPMKSICRDTQCTDLQAIPSVLYSNIQ